MKTQKLKKLIDAQTISKKIAEIGLKINEDYKDRNPLIIAVLKGSTLFLSDLIRKIDIDFELDFVQLSSYRKGTKKQELKILNDVNSSVRGRDIIVVEDIIDTGNSVSYLKNHLQRNKPSSIKICTLIDKLERRTNNINVDYRGFEIERGFLVGYGMDINEWGRNFPDIYVVEN